MKSATRPFSQFDRRFLGRKKYPRTQGDVIIGVLVDHPLEDLGGLEQLLVEVLVGVDGLLAEDLLDVERGRALLLLLSLALLLLLLGW